MIIVMFFKVLFRVKKAFNAKKRIRYFKETLCK